MSKKDTHTPQRVATLLNTNTGEKYVSLKDIIKNYKNQKVMGVTVVPIDSLIESLTDLLLQ
jgi:hypothetical protein